MRNLKRALSMALAAVMVLGLMVVSASAASYNDFTDKDEIVHKDAVAMVTELGVLAGLPDGSFGGTQNIDRASFARLVCVVLNGGKEPVLGNLTTSFTDTQGNWAEKYIAFCVDRGIIAGRGNNTFGPSDNVTGSEAAKKLLVALGYNTTYEGIGGSTWEITTNSLANMAGLYEDLEDINPSEPLTRDNAAQMIYNVLNANTVDYSFSFNADGSTTAVQNKSSKTMLEDKFGVVTVEGTVVANEFANLNGGNALDAGKTTVDVTNGGTNGDQANYGNGNETFNVSTGGAELGQSVSLFVKPATNASSNASKATVIGSVITSSENTVVTDSSRDTLADVLKDNKITADNTTLYSFQYGKAVTNDDSNFDNTNDPYGNQTDFATMLAKWNGLRGVVKTIIDNDDDGVAEYITFSRYDIGKVTTYTADDSLKLNSSAALEYDAEDVVGFENVSKNDYVLYAEIGGKLYVEVAKTVEGNLDAYNAGKSLTIDGTKYNTSDLYATGTYTNSDWTNANDYKTLDKTAVVYLDKEGNALVVDGSAVANEYGYITGSSYDSLDGARVKITLTDGTTGTYVVDKAYAADSTTKMTSLELKNAFEDGKAGDKLATYSINDDKEITVKFISSSVTDDNTSSATAYKFTKGNATITVDSKYYADESTMFFYVDADGNVSAYAGISNAPSVDKASVQKNIIIHGTGDEADEAKAVVLLDAETTTAGDYLYIYQTTGVNSNGTIANAIINGELVKDITVDSADLTNSLTGVATGVYRYSINSKGVYQLTDAPAKTVIGEITRVTSNSVVVDADLGTGNTSGEYTISGCTVATIDGSDTAVDGTLSKGQVVALVYDSDDKALAAYILEEYDEANANIVTASAPFTLEKQSDNAYNVKIDLSEYKQLGEDDFSFSGGATPEFNISSTYVAASDYVTVTAADGSTVITYTFVQK